LDIMGAGSLIWDVGRTAHDTQSKKSCNCLVSDNSDRDRARITRVLLAYPCSPVVRWLCYVHCSGGGKISGILERLEDLR
jgi:hypothetical protein